MRKHRYRKKLAAAAFLKGVKEVRLFVALAAGKLTASSLAENFRCTQTD